MPAYYFAPQCYLDKLCTIQNQALRICCGAMRSTPICALQAACNEMPLHLRHQYLCLNYKAKLLRLPKGSHPAQNLIEDSAEEVYCFTEQNIRTFNRFTKSTVFDQLIFEPYTPLGQPYWLLTSPVVDLELKKHLFKNDIPALKRSITLEYISEIYGKYTAVYTDGSKHSMEQDFHSTSCL